MSRPVSKGIGIHRTIYIPIDLVYRMGKAMASVSEQVVNKFVCMAIEHYCEEIELNESMGEEDLSDG